MRKLFLLLFVLCSLFGNAQKMNVAGNVQDTAAKIPLRYAVIMAVKLKDSIMVAYTRSDENGLFKLKEIPVDTYQVIISHPQFAEQSFYLFGSASNATFDFGKIILPPKSHSLNEVVIYAFKDPVYYKGDTLIYSADSFKVKPNATVEDLLKHLPGVQVDGKGKIKVQGKEVDKVLVDGDEFFGSDPTMATKNLNAKSVESVEVYDKKSETPSENGGDDVQKIMNLKLKDDAKKGYFGKTSGATDFNKFYEGSVMLNKFTSSKKVSVFGLTSNTPKSSLGWSDMNKYGLNNEQTLVESDEGYFYYSDGGPKIGLPQTLKTGVYYTDKMSKKTKLLFNYSYGKDELLAKTQTKSQYFLSDSNYTTNNSTENFQRDESHGLNFTFTHQIDSLTELEIKPKIKGVFNHVISNSGTEFLSNTNNLTRRTDVKNTLDGKAIDINTNVRIDRHFMKKGRELEFTYNNIYNDRQNAEILKSYTTSFISAALPSDSIDQQKTSSNTARSHVASLVFTEPVTKKIKLEFSYSYLFNLGVQDKKAYQFYNGDYSVKDNLLTNNFENTRNTNKVGAKFIYEIKKQRVTVGAVGRQIAVSNVNLLNDQKITQVINNVLPYFNYSYNAKDNMRLAFRYSTDSKQPTIDQLQPVPDNSNPNQLRVGNPNLLPTFVNRYSLTFNQWAGISGRGFWMSAGFATTNNDLSNSIVYDKLGRTITQTVNVDGNYNGNAYLDVDIPLFSKVLRLNPNVGFNLSNTSNYIDGQKNLTKLSRESAGLRFTIKVKEITIEGSANYGYSNPVSSLNKQSNLPFSSQNYNLSINLPFKKRLVFESNADFAVNSRRADGFNINYLIWNASIERNFLKNENLAVAVVATDVLNQNINATRAVHDNVITDSKTNLIGRYILLRVVFKFNSTKTKDDDSNY